MFTQILERTHISSNGQRGKKPEDTRMLESKKSTRSRKHLLFGCFFVNPLALISVSPLRPQSQLNIVVQNLLRGQGNASRKRAISSDLKPDANECRASKDRKVKTYLLSGGINQLSLSM